jgi:hypothetical protein
MTGTQVKLSAARLWWRIPLRFAMVLLLAGAVGGTLNHLSASLKHSAQPAGFGRGLLQGILMPMSLPNLLLGRDVEIYSLSNTGVTYKLGYTAGVNVCGAVFFSLLFWRLTRMRQWMRQRETCPGFQPDAQCPSDSSSSSSSPSSSLRSARD